MRGWDQRETVYKACVGILSYRESDCKCPKECFPRQALLKKQMHASVDFHAFPNIFMHFFNVHCLLRQQRWLCLYWS